MVGEAPALDWRAKARKREEGRGERRESARREKSYLVIREQESKSEERREKGD